jgi:hypothetical protein
MASWSSPSSAAAASGARFGPFPSRAQRLVPYPSLARGTPASTLVLRPHPDGRGHGLLAHTGSSSSRCRAVAAEVEGLNIANHVSQVTYNLQRLHASLVFLPVRCYLPKNVNVSSHMGYGATVYTLHVSATIDH